MKKILYVIIISAILFSLCACGGNSGKKSTNNGGKTVADVIESKTNGNSDNKNSDNSGESSKESTASQNKSGESSYESADIDLTKLNSTMVYSQVYNMMNKPADYRGKIVKMKGQFSVYHDDNTGKNYFACLIADATACCQQGIEFELEGEYKYPDDYPELGTEISVIGVYDTYKEGETQYCYLKKAEYAN